jgi:hypothetical protein
MIINHPPISYRAKSITVKNAKMYIKWCYCRLHVLRLRGHYAHIIGGNKIKRKFSVVSLHHQATTIYKNISVASEFIRRGTVYAHF